MVCVVEKTIGICAREKTKMKNKKKGKIPSFNDRQGTMPAQVAPISHPYGGSNKKWRKRKE
jgi:hypothetical protein